jgi:hypothetical protein
MAFPRAGRAVGRSSGAGRAGRSHREAIHAAAPLFRFMQENEATLRSLSALFTVHFGTIAESRLSTDRDVIRKAFLEAGLTQLDGGC